MPPDAMRGKALLMLALCPFGSAFTALVRPRSVPLRFSPAAATFHGHASPISPTSAAVWRGGWARSAASGRVGATRPAAAAATAEAMRAPDAARKSSRPEWAPTPTERKKLLPLGVINRHKSEHDTD